MSTQLAPAVKVSKGRMPDLMARLKGQCVAIPCDCVREVLLVPEVTWLPGFPRHVRGVINLRGNVIPLADLRMLFGFQSMDASHAELEEMLKARAADHHRWLAELESCVREKREFTLARDPHKCAFGKWYDTHKSENDTITFRSAWAALDKPHKHIHAIADVALGHAQRGEHHQAQKIIEETRNGALHEVCSLLDALGKVMRQTKREIAIVLSRRGHALAISADNVDCAEEIKESAIEPLQEQVHGDLVEQVAKRSTNKEMALMLNVDALFRRVVQ